MEEVALAVGLLAAVYGIADLIGRIAFYLLFPRRKGAYVVVPLCGDDPAVEYTARRLAMLCRFLPSGDSMPLLLDCGLGEDDRALAVRLAEELSIEFYTVQEWMNGLQENEIMIQ